jgi:ABC-type transport system substrate-binding protein
MPFLTETAQLAAESWRRELGLDVEVRVGDSIGLRERLYAGELNGQVYWQENDTRRDATTYTFGSFGDPDNPRYVHRDPEILKLVQETLQVLDPEERSEAYQELFVRLRDEGYYLGIGYANTPWAVGPRVLTWEPWPLALYPSALHTVTLK